MYDNTNDNTNDNNTITNTNNNNNTINNNNEHIIRLLISLVSRRASGPGGPRRSRRPAPRLLSFLALIVI